MDRALTVSLSADLFNTAVAYIIGLACSSVITDPYLTWDFGGCAIAGGILTVVFYFTFRHIDAEEYVISMNKNELEMTGTDQPIVAENELNKSINRPAPIAENEQNMISQKQ